MADSVKRFAKAVLERSASIGVRGELTASYLNELGFADTDIIGCPSMFLYGDTFPTIREARPLDATSRIALNLSAEALPVGDVSGLAAEAHRRFPQVTYFAQNISDAQALFWGDTSAEAGRVDDFPLRLSHPLFVEDKVTVPLDPKVWIEELAGYDFAHGTRIHGNVAALLAGTPSVVVAHDSRTLELCRYFDIPFRMLSDLPGDVDPQEFVRRRRLRQHAQGAPGALLAHDSVSRQERSGERLRARRRRRRVRPPHGRPGPPALRAAVGRRRRRGPAVPLRPTAGTARRGRPPHGWAPEPERPAPPGPGKRQEEERGPGPASDRTGEAAHQDREEGHGHRQASNGPHRPRAPPPHRPGRQGEEGPPQV